MDRNLLDNHEKKVVSFLFLASLLMSIVIAETFLRVLGFKPSSAFYTMVDELVVFDSFVTDGEGVFKANIASKEWSDEIVLNSEGFRGPEFTRSGAEQKSILILGDSFAWGASATPLTNSFPDMLRRSGIAVFNTGIPGTGPTQYEYIFNKYLSILNPDDVIVSFFTGNDLLSRPDPMIPFANLWHITNAGWIQGFDRENLPLTAEEAYDYYVGIRLQKTKEVLYRSALGTRIMDLQRIVRDRLKGTVAEGQNKNEPAENYKYTFDILQRIRTKTIEHGSRFHLLVIPSYGDGCRSEHRGVNQYRSYFEELNPIYLDDLPEHFYLPSPGCHFDNEGHAFVASRIKETLKKFYE